MEMSIYVMAVHELAKKYKMPAGELVTKLNEGGLPVKTHLQRLTQKDLDKIAIIMQGGTVEPEPEPEVVAVPTITAPARTELTTRELHELAEKTKEANVLIVKKAEREFVVLVVETSLTDDNLNANIIYRISATSKSRAMLERNKLAYIFKTEVV
jgi:hypothetical protein